MILIDVNLLVYAAIEASPSHAKAKAWLDAQLNGAGQVGLPWESLCGFVRVASNPRIVRADFTVNQAWRVVSAWLDSPNVVIPCPTPRHRAILQTLFAAMPMTHKLVSDAHLAAIAIGHNLTLASADTDFARFPALRYENPLEE